MCICTYIYTFIRTYIHNYVHTYTHVHIHVYIYLCIYIYSGMARFSNEASRERALVSQNHVTNFKSRPKKGYFLWTNGSS